jgi:hypothetical protein
LLFDELLDIFYYIFSSNGVNFNGLDIVLNDVKFISGNFFINYLRFILLNLFGILNGVFLYKKLRLFLESDTFLPTSLTFNYKSLMLILLVLTKFYYP